jgi:NAD(P)-dependent dehydrogenase (short-subunit alcohol dehydrogenase family)
MRLKDKVAIVTGAGSGMGAATARIFAREGAFVILTDIDADSGQQIAREIGNRAQFVQHDVSKEADWQKVVETALKSHGKIDILINNAGVSGSNPDRWSMDTWNQQMEVNAKGVFLGMRTVIPEMQKRKAGSIVNISSISGIAGQNFVHMGYNAAKGAVRTMTKAAAVQFGKDNVRVNSVHPGVMPPMKTSQMSADPEVRARVLKAIPMGRFGEVDEVANTNLFLASDEASYISGAEIVVDGGFIAQ